MILTHSPTAPQAHRGATQPIGGGGAGRSLGLAFLLTEPIGRGGAAEVHPYC